MALLIDDMQPELDHLPPSKVENPLIHWLWAHAPRGPGLRNQPQHGPNVGKWMIFTKHRWMDENWAKIKAAVEQDKLGITAKIATMGSARHQKSVVICVYTYDHTDASDRNRVRKALYDMGWTRTLYYKTDAMTYAGQRGSKYKS